MLLASLDPSGEPALLGEVLPEPHERAVQDLRDAALGQVEDPSYLPQRKALVIVEGGNYPLFPGTLGGLRATSPAPWRIGRGTPDVRLR